MNKGYFKLSIFFFTWFVLAAIVRDIAVDSKRLLLFIVGGQTFFNLYFFLLWTAGSFFVLSFKPKLPFKIPPVGLIIMILFMMALNATSHILYTLKYRLDFTAKTVAVAGGSMSVNDFAHTNTLKGLFVPLERLLGWTDLLYKPDSGASFYELLPHGFYAVAAIGLVLAFMSILHFLIVKEREFGIPLRYPLVFSYIIASFAVLKGSFDGGLFAPQFAVFFSAICCVLKVKEENTEKIFGIFGKYLLLSFAIFFFLYLLFDGLDLGLYGREGLGALSAFLFLIVLFHGLEKRSVWALAASLCLVLQLFLVTGIGSTERAQFSEGSAELRDGRLFILHAPVERLFPAHPRKEAVQANALDMQDQKTLLDFYRVNKVSPSGPDGRSLSQSCNPERWYSVQGKIRSVEDAGIVARKEPGLFEIFTIKRCADTGECDYAYTGIMKGCVSYAYVEKPLAIGQLLKSGFKKFIILDKTQDGTFGFES